MLGHGLVPILEPEVDIKSPQKAAAEELLKAAILERLDGASDRVMLKLSLPSVDGFYTELIEHPKVLRVVALSGGYSRDEANAILARNPGMIASFSRALTEGLTAQQTDAEFDAALDDGDRRDLRRLQGLTRRAGSGAKPSTFRGRAHMRGASAES